MSLPTPDDPAPEDPAPSDDIPDATSDAARPAAGGWIILAIVGLLAGLIIVGGGVRRARTDSGTDAYTRLVQTQFIEKNLLVVRRSVDETGVPIVDLAPEVYQGKLPQAWRYAVQSFLLADIQRNDPSLWTIENGRVTGIDTQAHKTPPPFADRRGWSGRVLYRRAPSSQVRADEVILKSQGWAGPRLRLNIDARDIGTADPRVLAVVLDRNSDADMLAPGMDFYCRAGDPDPVARVRRVGDQAFVKGGPGGACDVTVGVTPLRAGDFRPLPPGARLTVVDGQRRYGFERVLPSLNEEAISAPSAGPGRVRKADIGWWGQAIEHDFIHATRSGAASVPSKQRLTTAIDPDLQGAAQDELFGFMGALPPEPRGKPRIAAITVMNSLTGEVLAMASWPRADQAPTLVDQDDPAAKAARLNQNLQLLPIGSAAKPVISAAILVEHPELATLQIPYAPGAATDNLLGMPISKLNGHPGQGPEDFNLFLQWSDNIYAAALLLLGTPDHNGRCRLAPGQSYTVNGKTETFDRPRSAFEAPGTDGFCKPHAPEGERQVAWADALHALFGVNIDPRGRDLTGGEAGPNSGGWESALQTDGAYLCGAHDATPWRDLFSRNSALIPCRFSASSPQREAFAITSAMDFRRDLLPVMLGNGEGMWSAVKMAEAYSRLATGERVMALFTPAKSTKPLPRIDGFDEARRVVTQAMTLVPFGTATGADLRPALQEASPQLNATGRVLGAFAKTGTPVVPDLDYRPVDKAINLLIAHGALSYEPRGGFVRIVSRGQVADLPAEATNAQLSAAARLLADDPQFSIAGPRFHVSASLVAKTLSGYAVEIRAGGKPLILERARFLVRVRARIDDGAGESDEKVPHGKVVGVVIAAYRRDAPRLALDSKGWAADASARPICAYTVVVTMPFPYSGGNPKGNIAADIAGHLIRSAITPRLLACQGAS